MVKATCSQAAMVVVGEAVAVPRVGLRFIFMLHIGLATCFGDASPGLLGIHKGFRHVSTVLGTSSARWVEAAVSRMLISRGRSTLLRNLQCRLILVLAFSSSDGVCQKSIGVRRRCGGCQIDIMWSTLKSSQWSGVHGLILDHRHRPRVFSCTHWEDGLLLPNLGEPLILIALALVLFNLYLLIILSLAMNLFCSNLPTSRACLAPLRRLLHVNFIRSDVRAQRRLVLSWRTAFLVLLACWRRLPAVGCPSKVAKGILSWPCSRIVSTWSRLSALVG